MRSFWPRQSPSVLLDIPNGELVYQRAQSRPVPWFVCTVLIAEQILAPPDDSWQGCFHGRYLMVVTYCKQDTFHIENVLDFPQRFCVAARFRNVAERYLERHRSSMRRLLCQLHNRLKRVGTTIDERERTLTSPVTLAEHLFRAARRWVGMLWRHLKESEGPFSCGQCNQATPEAA